MEVKVIKPDPSMPATRPYVQFKPGGVYTENGSTYIMIYENDINSINFREHGHRYALVAPLQGGAMATNWISQKEMIEHLNKPTNNYVYRSNAKLVITIEPHETGI